MSKNYKLWNKLDCDNTPPHNKKDHSQAIQDFKNLKEKLRKMLEKCRAVQLER